MICRPAKGPASHGDAALYTVAHCAGVVGHNNPNEASTINSNVGLPKVKKGL